MSAVHALAFGDAQVWGVAWAAAEGASTALAVGAGGTARMFDVELSLAEDPWRVEGDGVSLLVTPQGATGHGAAADGLQSTDEVCTVSGAIELEPGGGEIDGLGWRSSVEGALEFARISSFRQTAGWFQPPHGFSLLALRPRKARGQEADLVAATVLEAEPTAAVSDPRLSTTYDAAGRPTRAGLELWLEPEPRRESEEDRAPPFPRRAAGEAVGPGITWTVGDLRLYATLLRWYSRGSEGAGIYLLGERE